MKPAVQMLSLIPPPFLDRPHVATRYLFGERKPGRLTALFQRHGSHSPLPMVLHAYPASLDTDPAYRRREDFRVFGASYALAGTATLVNARSGHSYPVRPGTLFQYNGQTLSDLVLHPAPGFTECSVSLDGDTGRALEALDMWNSALVTAVPGLHVSILRAYLDLYDAILDTPRTTRGLLSQLTALLDHAYSFVERPDADSRFRTVACSLLASHLSPRYTMRQAAADLGLPYEHFRKRFRAAVGMAPIVYQVRRPMEQACLLLEHHSVKETALLLDYTDPYVFSGQFSRHTGIAPSAFTPRQRGRTTIRSGEPTQDA